MLDSVIAFLWSSDMGGQTFVGNEVNQQRAATFIDLIYATKSDDYISVSTMTDTQWKAFCTVTGRPDLLADPRFETPALRDKHADERLTLIQEVLLEKPGAEWLQILDDAGVPCAPVLKRRDMISHPQVVASEIVVEHDHPHAGRLRQARAAARFEGTPTTIRYGAPLFGEHTREVLSEVGYSAQDIGTLVANGVLHAANDDA